MQTISIFLNKIKLASFGKNIFGKLTVRNFKNIDSQDWKNEVLDFLKSDEIALTIPNEITVVQRLKISPEIVGTALKQTILKKVRERTGILSEELIFSYERRGSGILFLAVEKEELRDFFSRLKSRKLKSALVIPKILADFEIFKKGIAEGETTVFVEKEGSIIHFSFFDHFGPAAYFKKTGNLENTAEETIGNFEKSENEKIKRIILGGSEVLNINLDYFSKRVGIWTTKAEKILQERIVEKNLKVDVRDESLVLFLANFGVYFYSLENQKLNLFKNGLSDDKKKQEKELEIKTTPVVIKEFSPPTLKSSFPIKVSKKLFFVIFIVLILTTAVFVSWRFLAKKSENKNAEQNQNIQAPTPTPTPAPKLEKSELKIQVLNGSGQKGAASSLKKLLVESGYNSDIKTGNADNFAYEETVIEIKNEKKNYLNLLLDDLKSKYNISSDYEVLDEDSDFDAVIIIGSDEK